MRALSRRCARRCGPGRAEPNGAWHRSPLRAGFFFGCAATRGGQGLPRIDAGMPLEHRWHEKTPTLHRPAGRVAGSCLPVRGGRRRRRHAGRRADARAGWSCESRSRTRRSTRSRITSAPRISAASRRSSGPGTGRASSRSLRAHGQGRTSSSCISNIRSTRRNCCATAAWCCARAERSCGKPPARLGDGRDRVGTLRRRGTDQGASRGPASPHPPKGNLIR